MNNKNWSMFLALFQIKNMDCLSSFSSFYIYVQSCSEKKKKKIMLQIESDWVWKYYTKLRTNSVKPHQNRINLFFLRSKSTCEENVFQNGVKGPGTIINVKEP